MINLTVVIDNDEAVRKLHELQRVAKSTTSSVVKDSERMDASWQQMKSTLMSLTAGVSFAALAKQIVQIRGEVQQLEVAFETMLGSKEKADTLMSEIIDLAAKTPFGLQDVSNATKMLLAYGSTAEEVAGEIKMLGNIASGLSIPLNDLIYLYGTTRTQGRMFTQDLRQFMGRGIPLAEELAKQFGVTKDKVGELVTAGRVGFDDMAKALRAMSSEGGKFNNLMDKQSATISGQISNLEDSIYQMFNEIGKSSEGVISDLISGASWVVEHYQEVLNVLKYLIAAYGSYKAALIAVAAVEHVRTMGMLAKTLYDVARGAQTAAAAFQLLNSSKKGWIGVAAGVVSALAIATLDLSKSSEEATKQMGALEKAARDEYVEVNRLVATLQQGNTTEKERNDILAQLKSINPDIVKGISDEADITAILTSNLKAYNEEQVRKIQLSAISDKQTDAITDKANAGLVLGEAEVEAKKAITQIQAALNMGELLFDTRTTNQNFSKKSDFEKAKIQQLITDEISQILQSSLSNIDKVKAIRNIEVMTNPSNRGGYRKTGIIDVGGVDLLSLINNWDKAYNALQAADQALIKLTADNEQLAEILGLSGDKVEDNTEAAENYAKAYADAQKAYIDAQKEFNAIKNDPKASVEQWQAAKDNLESMKKAYEDLGGVTSSKVQTDAQKQAKEAAKLAKELQYNADQAVIDAMAEGTEKKVAQIELDYRKRADAIRQQEADLMAKRNGGELSKEEKEAFYDLNIANSQAYWDDMTAAIFGDTDAQAKAAFDKLKKDKAAWNEYLIEYGTFQERLKAITIKYNQSIADAQTEGERKALEAERDAILAEYEVKASDWAKGLVDMSIGQLNKMLTELQAQVDAKQAAFDALDSLDSQQAKDYQKDINTLNAKIKELQERLKKVNGDVKDGNWAEATQVLQNMSGAADNLAESFGKTDSAIGVILSSISQLTGATIGFISSLQSIEKAATKLERASIILLVFSTAMKVIKAIADGIPQIFEQNEEAAKNAAVAVFKYEEALKRLNSIEQPSIFGEDSFGEFRSNLDRMRDLSRELESAKNDLAKSGTWEGISSLEEGLALENALTKAEKLGVQYALIADMRSKWQKAWGTGKKNIEVADLEDFYEDGKLNVDKLKTWYDTYKDYVSETQSVLIEELIADWEAYENAVEATNEYLVSMFGEAGNAIKDALVYAFESGTDAAQQMGDTITDVVEKIVSDMVFAATIQPYLDEFSEYMKTRNNWLAQGWITEEKYIEDLTSGANHLLSQLERYGSPAYNAMMDAMSDRFGLFDGSAPEQSATQKGFQAMSQDTGDELNGRFTDIQGKVSGIHEAVQFMKGIGSEQLQRLTNIHSTVASIHNDTTLIEQHTRVLGQMSDDLASLKRAVVNDGLI